MDREEISQIMYEELDNQPMASQLTKDSCAALDNALDQYINAVQEDAFFFGFITAMKCKRNKCFSTKLSNE